MSAARGISFVLDEELSEDDLVAIVVTLPSGQALRVWAQVALEARTMILRQLAIYGVRLGPGEVGMAGVGRVALAAMEEFDVDSIRIEETRRIAGARSGRAVPAIELRRPAREPDP